ncbi:hypothetical protein SAMN04487788_0031 [Microbacterium testaceum StLB037]|uniref:Uncharacterized protein n=1 Tax=Microbacterium testaceum (strain StLB037) TaxID=979556 RepID=A0A1H0KJZ1_MICTS|nr:hypothetical protein [Microbacterium testaceum]SDO56051.1 hypothetical protein SAMN04487788_0031 [Microbacterium testaceum StLB037]
MGADVILIEAGRQENRECQQRTQLHHHALSDDEPRRDTKARIDSARDASR